MLNKQRCSTERPGSAPQVRANDSARERMSSFDGRVNPRQPGPPPTVTRDDLVLDYK